MLQLGEVIEKSITMVMEYFILSSFSPNSIYCIVLQRVEEYRLEEVTEIFMRVQRQAVVGSFHHTGIVQLMVNNRNNTVLCILEMLVSSDRSTTQASCS